MSNNILPDERGFGACQAEALELTRAGDYEGARQLYLAWRLGHAVMNTTQLTVDTMYASINTGTTYILQALHSPDASRPVLLAQAASMLDEVLTLFQDSDFNQQVTASRAINGRSTPHLKGVRAAIRSCELLMQIHTIAAADSRYNWEPGTDHLGQVDKLAREGIRAARLMRNWIISLNICVGAVRAAILAGDKEMTERWVQEENNIFSEAKKHNVAQISGIHQAHRTLDEVRTVEDALASLYINLGIFNPDPQMIILAESDT